MESIKPKIQTLEGIVVSDKMNKTIVVKVSRVTTHPKYKKRIRKDKKYKVHDEKNQSKVGDYVKIVSCRPISKDKRWRLLSIIRKGEVK